MIKSLSLILSSTDKSWLSIIPFSVALNDFKTKIYSAINECNLHPSIVKMVIENLYKEISVTANEFEKKEIHDYNNKK